MVHTVAQVQVVSGGAHCNPSYWGPSLSGYDNCMGRRVGGSNLGQTQVELSGLNRVFHKLGPPRGVAEYIHW